LVGAPEIELLILGWMQTFQDEVEKACYAVRMMRLARWISGRLCDDYEARVVGRMVLVFAPIYIECAFRLLKKPGLSDPDRRQLREAVRALRDDFEGYYSQIRNDLSAHRDVIGLDLAIEAWNEIDSDTLDWFCVAAEENIGDITDRHSLMSGSLRDFDALGNDEFACQLAAQSGDEEALRFSTDTLALTRGHASFIPLHPVQDSVSVLMSVWESLQTCHRINGLARRQLSAHLLLKTMFVIDAINFIDNLYGEPVGASDKRSPALLSIMEDDGFAGATPLSSSLEAVDLAAVQSVRGVRNKACAHLDRNHSLRHLQDMVLDIEDEVILNRVLNPAWTALNTACAADLSTRWLLMNEVSMAGLRPASTPGVRAFHRDRKPG
jgi:hypothetical protein